MIRTIKPKYRNKVTELFGRYQCDNNGNYLPVQCSDTQCYCVNQETGFADDRTGTAGTTNSKYYFNALRSEPESIKKLYCYQEYCKNSEDELRLNELLGLPNK